MGPGVWRERRVDDVDVGPAFLLFLFFFFLKSHESLFGDVVVGVLVRCLIDIGMEVIFFGCPSILLVGLIHELGQDENFTNTWSRCTTANMYT